MSKKVLVVDDDPELGLLLDLILKPLELMVYHAYSGREGLTKAYAIHPDLVILDINLPDMDGFNVCSQLREFVSIPILMLTARTNEKDLLHGFTVGADDFVRKPFNKDELGARVLALLKRSQLQNNVETPYITLYKDLVLEVDLSAQIVKLCGEIVELSSKEYAVLACLVNEQGKILSHRELVRKVWGEMYTNGPAISSLYIYYLRNKLQDGQHGHQYFHTLWGKGYWFAPRKDFELS